MFRRWDEPLAEAVADGDGRFDVLVDPGPVDVEASAPGFATRERSALAPEPDDVTIVLRLPRLATLTGRVVRDDTGEGIAGALVSAAPTDSERGKSGETRADEAGAFRFEAIEGGAYELGAEAVGLSAVGVHVVVRAGESSSGIVLRAKRAATVRGRLDVVDRAGITSPCRDGEVTFRSPISPQREAAVDETGRWELAALPPGKYAVFAQCGAAIDFVPLPPVVVTSADRDLVLTARERNTLHGTVTSGTGEPLPGLMIYAHPDPTNVVAVSDSAYTDAEGAFSLRNLEPGGYNVILEKFESVSKRHVDIDGGSSAPVDIVLHLHTLGGRVVDREGHPVPDAQVELRGFVPEGDRQLIEVVDDAGRFTISYVLPPGGAPNAELRVDVAGETTPVDGGNHVQLPTRGEITVVVNAAGGVLAGEVLDPVGRAVEDADVHLSCEGYGASRRTDEAGHFTFANVPPDGACEIEARDSAGQSGKVPAAHVGKRNLVSLRPAALLRGVLANEGGPFRLQVGGAIALSRHFPGPSGAWELRLPAGDYHLEASTETRRGAISVQVAAAETRVVVIPLEPIGPDDDD